MSSSKRTVAEAKLRAAQAAAYVAQADLRAAQAQAAVAQAELDLALLMNESDHGLSPDLSQSNRQSSKDSSSSPAGLSVFVTAPVPSSTYVSPTQTNDVAALDHTAPRAAVDFGMSVATACGSVSISKKAGAFSELGHGVRLRAWHICRGGQEGDKCNTFTVAEGWRVNWTLKQKTCCRASCDTKYKWPFGMIAQIQVQDTDYFVRTDCHNWWEADFEKGLVEAIEKSNLSMATARAAHGTLSRRTFDSLFRQATQEEVKVDVDANATFIVHEENLWNGLTEMLWVTLCGVIKHMV